MLILIVFSAVWESLGQEVLWARKLVCVMKYFVLLLPQQYLWWLDSCVYSVLSSILCYHYTSGYDHWTPVCTPCKPVFCVFIITAVFMMTGHLCVLFVIQYFVWLSPQQFFFFFMMAGLLFVLCRAEAWHRVWDDSAGLQRSRGELLPSPGNRC